MYFMIPVNSIWGKPKFLVEVFVCTLTAESKDGTRTALNPLAGMLNLGWGEILKIIFGIIKVRDWNFFQYSILLKIRY